MAAATPMNTMSTAEPNSTKAHLVFKDLHSSKWAPTNMSGPDTTIEIPACKSQALEYKFDSGKKTTGRPGASVWALTEKPAPEKPTAGLAASKWATTSTPAPEQPTTSLAASKWAPMARSAPKKPIVGLAARKWASTNEPAAEQPTAVPAATNRASIKKPTVEQPSAGLAASKWATKDKSAAHQPTAGLVASRWAPPIKNAPRRALQVLANEECLAAGRKGFAGQIQRQAEHKTARPAKTESALADCGDDEIPAEHSGTRTRARAWAELCFGERKAALGNRKYARQWIMGQLQAFGMTKTAWIVQLVDEEVDRAERMASATQVG